MIIGRDLEGIPITIGTPSDVMLDKYTYQRATKIAEDMSFEYLKAFIQGMDDFIKEKNPISRGIDNFLEKIFPDLQTMAIREVYERRKKTNFITSFS